MKRVTNFTHYKENWADYMDFMFTLWLEVVVGLAMIIGFTFALLLVLLGYEPDEETFYE